MLRRFALILTALIGQVARRMQALRTNEHATQCSWLAQSALQLARVRLRQDADYPGEIWDVAEGQPLPRAGRVEIQVVRRDGLLVVDVVAAYPLEEHDTVRRRLQATWLAPQGDEPDKSAATENTPAPVVAEPPATSRDTKDPMDDTNVNSNQQPTPGDRPPRPPFSQGDVR